MPDNTFYLTDAHPLLWFLAADRRLSERAKELLLEAQRREREVGIPIIALTEAARAIEKRRVSLTLGKLLELVRGTGFIVLPFDMAVFEAVLKASPSLELHDRVIVATAQAYKGVLITRDPEMVTATRTIW